MAETGGTSGAGPSNGAGNTSNANSKASSPSQSDKTGFGGELGAALSDVANAALSGLKGFANVAGALNAVGLGKNGKSGVGMAGALSSLGLGIPGLNNAVVNAAFAAFTGKLGALDGMMDKGLKSLLDQNDPIIGQKNDAVAALMNAKKLGIPNLDLSQLNAATLQNAMVGQILKL